MSHPQPFKIGRDAHQIEFLVIPNGTEDNLSFTAVVDGKKFEVDTERLFLKPGVFYHCKLAMKGVGMKVDVIKIEPFVKEDVDIEFVNKDE